MAEIVYEDIREDILQRLLVLMAMVDDEFEVRRNETHLSDNQKYVVLLDGSEESVGEAPGRRSPGDPPYQIMQMIPEIQFRQPAGKVRNIGTDLNRLRIRLMAIVLTDEILLAMTVKRASAHLAGSNMVAERGRSMEGGIGVAFKFNYLLRPAQVAA